MKDYSAGFEMRRVIAFEEWCAHMMATLPQGSPPPTPRERHQRDSDQARIDMEMKLMALDQQIAMQKLAHAANTAGFVNVSSLYGQTVIPSYRAWHAVEMTKPEPTGFFWRDPATGKDEPL